MLFIGGISQGRKLLNYAESILAEAVQHQPVSGLYDLYVFQFFLYPRCLSGISAFMCRCPVAAPFTSWSRRSEKPY